MRLTLIKGNSDVELKQFTVGTFMTEKNQIMEELKNKIKEMKEYNFLHSICDEIFEEYFKGSAKAVSELLQGKIKPLKNDFDDAHTNLLKKMGL